MAAALSSAIKTNYSLYISKENSDGEIPESTVMTALRYSDCSLEGTVEQIESDVVLPGSRIKSIPETGTQSSSGDITTEWNIDEQDDMIAATMCSSWVTDSIDTSKKTLELGTTRNTFSVIKKYLQAPVEYKHYTGIQFNQLEIGLELNSFAKMTWSIQGDNQPAPTITDPIASITGASYGTASTTKSFITLEGDLKIGDSLSELTVCRQSSTFTLTINNNMEATQGLFEKKAIEQSLGDFEVTGSFDIWNSGDFARTIEEDAIAGKEKYIQVTLTRTVGTTKTDYVINLIAHLDSSEEATDGNKLKKTISFTVGRSDGLKFTKQTSTVSA